ncbi:MAG TPA: hypothetical protein VKP30_03540 [Polyangiaceae bacterium]|nr:hypothetical protein [Polyangiaceae bacterium]
MQLGRDTGTPFTSVKGALFGVAVATAFGWCSHAHGQEQAESVVRRAEWLTQRGLKAEARELVQRAAQQQPAVELLALALARAYLAEDNPFWAIRVLGDFVDRSPPACASRAMAARVHLQQANLDLAEQMLSEQQCQATNELGFRFHLLRIELAELQGDATRARKLVRVSRAFHRRYVEDDQRYARLKLRYDPDSEPAFAFKLGLSAGWASNGLSSVPLDLLPKQGASGSPLLGLELRTRWNLKRWSAVRLFAEGDFVATQYLDAPTKELSTRQPTLRLMALVGRGVPRLLIGYTADWVNLDGGDTYRHDSFTYSTAHHLEYRFDLGRSFFTHGQLGPRHYWESARNRFEVAQGLSKRVVLSDSLDLAIGALVHAYAAKERAYDQVGASVLSGLEIRMPNDFTLEEQLSLSQSVHPNSEGYFENSSAVRRDTEVQVSVALATPELFGLRLFPSYALVHRDSSIDPYDFTDHRGLLTVSWQSDSDRIVVHRISPEGRVPLSYPDEASAGRASPTVDVVEAIRQDEAQRRNNSCAK